MEIRLQRTVVTDDLYQPRVLTFSTGRAPNSGIIAVLLIAGFIAVVGTLPSTNSASSRLGGGTSILALVVLLALFKFVKQTTVEFNTTTRRLSVVHQWLDGPSRRIVDCSFDECDVIGTAQYNNEGGAPSYGIYLRLKNGKQYAIPSDSNVFEDVATTVRQLTAATGIRRLDAAF